MVNNLEGIWLTVGSDHEYISPTWPASLTSEGFTVAAIVTPYYRNGNILEHARRNPNNDYLTMICQVASAVAYIHSKGVVHGNICPVRVFFVIVNFA
jgi:serine/threonine protein kinase